MIMAVKASPKAKDILARIEGSTKLGDLRTIAKEIKKDHALAMELWSAGGFMPRQLSVLIMDPKQLVTATIDRLDHDIQQHAQKEKLQLIDWLMANKLSKDKKLTALMLSWKDADSPLKRRLFWYYNARLRWVGQTPPPDSEELLSAIEKGIEREEPEVQWAMNFLAAQIGIFQPEFRSRCIALGERTGLYKDEVVPRNCTPNYLPEFIRMQVAKVKK